MELVLAIAVFFLVVGPLVGWTFRENARRRRQAEEAAFRKKEEVA